MLERQAHAAGTTPPPSTHVVIGQAQAIVDHVASFNVGLMQPAVDAQGNVWVGEMYANRFARFDSHSEKVTTWKPPHANYGIMTTTVDAHGNPWFVEQDTNSLGCLDRTTQTFRIFPLGTVHGQPLGPQDLHSSIAKASSGLRPRWPGALDDWIQAPAGSRPGQSPRLLQASPGSLWPHGDARRSDLVRSPFRWCRWSARSCHRSRHALPPGRPTSPGLLDGKRYPRTHLVH